MMFSDNQFRAEPLTLAEQYTRSSSYLPRPAEYVDGGVPEIIDTYTPAKTPPAPLNVPTNDMPMDVPVYANMYANTDASTKAQVDATSPSSLKPLLIAGAIILGLTALTKD